MPQITRKVYANSEIAGSEEVERFAIGPIPAFAFHTIRYVTVKEAEQMIANGDALPNEIQPHPIDPNTRVFGEWLHDTFMPKLLLNEDQLYDIPDTDLDQWEADDWVIVPWDSQWMVKS